MDAKSLQTLELPKILDRLAGFSAFSASRELAHGLTPTTDLAEAQRRQAETSEARLLLSVKSDLTIGGAHDVRPQTVAASRGAVLEPAQLSDVKNTLIAARTLARTFEKSGERFPRLVAIAGGLQPCPGLIDAISRTLDERGEVLDSASDALAAIRRDLRVAHERLLGKLQRLIADPKTVPMLQEAIITQREGRFVIPLRAEFKGRIKSVVHDQSASGATLFVEPLAVVDLNNQVRELELAERDEIRRILAALSRQVGEHAGPIEATVEAIARLDLCFAKARYAEAMRASEPLLKPFAARSHAHPGSVLHLLAARHPLLDPATVVPIDLVLEADTYALVLTGPNTGGKTVSLKTVGLLALMAQCGLHLPATSGSMLSVFDGVYADIGDEQSIEQSLSTFSSHVTNTIRILGAAGPRSLVVLDELGAGTDPQEGSALARALLSAFLDRSITVLVATHYPELKVYAHATPGVRNASVEFDLETLRPTYHLTVGLPGRSNALAIAERLGLDRGIIEQARQMVAPEDLRAESLLDEIHRQRDAARAAREEAEGSRQATRRAQAELLQRLDAIDDERQVILEETRHQAEAEVEVVRDELRQLRRKLASAAQPLEAVKALEGDLGALEEQLKAPVERDARGEGGPARGFHPGDRVRLQTLAAEGVITALGEAEAEVQVGRLRVRAKLEELTFPDEAEPSGPKRRRKGSKVPAPATRPSTMASVAAPPLEIDLRGRLADEALEELDRHLDAAFLAGMPFLRVIHGKGTGRLREAIRQALHGNRYVRSFESGSETEGGEGVTVIRLASS
jgi:DNA mismatch repair protein MutS2